ncbi:integrator complex subunit 2-like [Ornithodoros turicata]|uniref:integrator complex subunit 2-like n=1 Tax=Ornithodoros turicata TaxID=34597 RepID=UPI0031386C83
MLKITSNERERVSVTPRAYDAIQKVDVDNLSALPEWELRPLLPCLVRMALCSPLDQRKEWSQKKKTVLKILSGIELVNSLVALLSIDFHALEIDVKKEQQLRIKLGVHPGDSILASSLQNSLALEFERSDAARKLRLVLSELLSFIAQTKDSRTELGVKSSDLFDNNVYLDEVSDVMCIAHAELPGILHIQDIAETLIHLKNGPFLLCRLIANAPDSFSEVCLSLISNGEKQDEDTSWGCIRMQALHLLCQMNPHQALVIRAKAVEMCRMPGLSVLLTLSHCNGDASDIGGPSSGDLVAFVSGILLGSDDKVRTWFAQYVRNCQKKGESGKDTTLQALRDELLQRLQRLLNFSSKEQDLADSRVVQANSLLRLFCALRGIAGLKFTEEEIVVLVRLLTSHPPPSPAGIRFVSLGLCMLLACPSLVLDHEKQVIQWIQWLMEEESYFGRTSGVHASFGEMLLLIAIHFHGNQVAPITELVCSTLGMKIPIRQNSLSKMKNIFTQELFTDQVVTAHAVKVAVTPNLSSNTIGFLPVHCIYQLLKSRAFTKYKVRIKDWVYKQICASIPPLHPILPALVEVYVNSVIVPSSKGSHDTTNEPLTEDEISVVFGNSLQNGDTSTKQASTSSGLPTLGDDCSNQMAPQLLLLYYLLLYEDTRLNNMKAIVASGRKVKRYSGDFLAQLPMRYLVVTAQRDERFAGLFPPLLRLLATHYPQLCMVDDWLRGESGASVTSLPRQRFGPRLGPRVPSNVQSLAQAFCSLHMCPIDMMSQLDRLNTLPLHQLWPYARPLVTNLPLLLQEGTPRQVIERAKQVWWRLNEVFPRRLWVMTANALRPPKHAQLRPLCLDDLVMDPLHVLRCDTRVFRCAPLLELVLHMLHAFLAASRTHLNHHLLEHPVVTDKGDAADKDREELRVALVAVQESAAVQILLECCLATDTEKMKDSGFLTDLREIQTLICTHLHQVFIGDPNLVRLVHFQGYPSELLPVSVSLIPSMHICLDFIPELLSQPQLEKQVFAIELASYLCLQYSIAKSLSIARLCVNVTHTLLGVLPGYQRPLLFLPSLPALVRMCKAFPPLSEDVSILLLQLGRVCLSQECTAAPPQLGFSANQLDKCGGNAEIKSVLERLPTNSALCRAIQKSFADLCDSAVLNRAIY